ncbi:uncharacterized protein TNCV_4311881 [Trichonephila clavipes]|nr:uncharacterized protein TNCV_4311881 [Trichonephila clavipes]
MSGVKKKKKLSGSQKRKIRKEKEYNNNRKYAKLDNFLISVSPSSCASSSRKKESENENEETKLIGNDFVHYECTPINADLREQILKLGPYQPQGNFQKTTKEGAFHLIIVSYPRQDKISKANGCAIQHDFMLLTVRCFACGKAHSVILRPGMGSKMESPTRRPVVNNLQTTTARQICTGEVALMTLWVRITGIKRHKNVRVLLDCGSQRSYISESLAAELKLPIVPKENVALTLFGGSRIG